VLTSPLAQKGRDTILAQQWRRRPAWSSRTERRSMRRRRRVSRRMLRLRIPVRSVISSRETFRVKELNQVPKYDGTSCRSSRRTITLRSPKFLWRVTGRSRRLSGTLSFLSLPVDSFLISSVSRLYANIAKPTKIGCPTSVKRTLYLSRRARRVLWSRCTC